MNLLDSSPSISSPRPLSRVARAGRTWWLVTVVFAVLCIAALPNALNAFRLGEEGLAACVVDLGFPCSAPAPTAPGLEVVGIFLALFVTTLVAGGVAIWRTVDSADTHMSPQS